MWRCPEAPPKSHATAGGAGSAWTGGGILITMIMIRMSAEFVFVLMLFVFVANIFCFCGGRKGERGALLLEKKSMKIIC